MGRRGVTAEFGAVDSDSQCELTQTRFSNTLLDQQVARSSSERVL